MGEISILDQLSLKMNYSWPIKCDKNQASNFFLILPPTNHKPVQKHDLLSEETICVWGVQFVRLAADRAGLQNDSMEYLWLVQSFWTVSGREAESQTYIYIYFFFSFFARSQKERERIIDNKRQVQSLVNKSKTIVRLKPRNPEEKSSSPVMVQALCDFKQEQVGNSLSHTDAHFTGRKVKYCGFFL